MKKPITLVLALMLCFSQSVGVVTPFVTTAYAAEDSADTTTGKNEGKYFGVIDGYNRGLLNYKTDNLKAKYKETYDDDLKVYSNNSEFKLKTYEYKQGFSDGYLEGYQYGYSLGIEGSLFSPNELVNLATSTDYSIGTLGTASGQNLGSAAGGNQATLDFVAGNGRSSYGSLSRYEAEKSLKQRYFLNSSNDSAFINDFLVAFRDSYQTAYDATYQALMDTFTLQNNTYAQINNKEGSYEFGLNPASANLTLQFNFPEGSMFGEGFIVAYKNRSPVYYDTKRLKFVDIDFFVDVYSESNFTHSDYIDFNKPFEMKVEYYGSDEVGIYEYKNGAWQYILTDIEEGFVSHEFPADTYSGGQYCLFLEPNFKQFSDTAFSPFNDEIYVYARRGAVYSNSNKLYPSGNISRGELAYIINGILNPTGRAYTSKTTFSDSSKFNQYENAVNFVNYNGYMNGVSSDKFNVNGTVTYSQVETIVERITGEDLNMSTIFNKMRNEKYHKSKGIYDMNKPISREEAIFILYETLR